MLASSIHKVSNPATHAFAVQKALLSNSHPPYPCVCRWSWFSTVTVNGAATTGAHSGIVAASTTPTAIQMPSTTMKKTQKGNHHDRSRRKPPAAVRHLARHGIEALKPQLVVSPYPPDPTAMYGYSTTRAFPPLPRSSPSHYRWRPKQSSSSDPKYNNNNNNNTNNGYVSASIQSDAEGVLHDEKEKEEEEEDDEFEEETLHEPEPPMRRSWHRPKVSRRKAHVLRKQAIREGTYGSFSLQLEGHTNNSTAGSSSSNEVREEDRLNGHSFTTSGSSSGRYGWDPAWDADFLRSSQSKNSRLGRYRITPPKKASRHRTRKERMAHIDKSLIGMDERMEAYHAARIAQKPQPSFLLTVKKMMQLKKS